MFILGLTGSIGMGKSETARMFRRLGVPVFDADAAVAALYGHGGEAVAVVGRQFPGCVVDGVVDRAKLSAAVLGKPEALARLEALVHPLVLQARRRFLAAEADKGAPIVVLDIPLLYETGGERDVDAVLVVSAPPDMQRARVFARPGMTQQAFAAILARQLPDAEKRGRASFVIETGRGLDDAFQQVKRVLGLARLRKAHIWEELKAKGVSEAR